MYDHVASNSKDNDVKFARFVLLAVSAWRSRNISSSFASLTEQDIEEDIVEDKDSQNTKRSTKEAKELFAVYESNRSMYI